MTMIGLISLRSSSTVRGSLVRVTYRNGGRGHVQWWWATPPPITSQDPVMVLALLLRTSSASKRTCIQYQWCLEVLAGRQEIVEMTAVTKLRWNCCHPWRLVTMYPVSYTFWDTLTGRWVRCFCMSSWDYPARVHREVGRGKGQQHEIGESTLS